MFNLRQKFCRHDFEVVKDSVSKCVDFETKTTLNAMYTNTKCCRKCGLIVSDVKLDGPTAKRVDNLEE